VAERYDVMNDAMSAGMHRLWKDQLVETLGPMRGTTIVDLAGGTGDVAFRIMEKLRHQPVPKVDGFDTRLVSRFSSVKQLLSSHPFGQDSSTPVSPIVSSFVFTLCIRACTK
jgi:hypothetical protein